MPADNRSWCDKDERLFPSGPMLSASHSSRLTVSPRSWPDGYSVEDVVMGAIPGLPKVYLHNPVLACENGDDFMKFFYQAEKGEVEPFGLVVEGSIPNERIKSEGYWAAVGTDERTGQPIKTCDWIDRLAPKALALVGAGTSATYGGIHAMAGNPTGRPFLQSNGGDVELVSITDGVVKVRVQKEAGGCSSTALTMKSAVEDAVTEGAPDAAQILTEVVQQPTSAKLVVIT